MATPKPEVTRLRDALRCVLDIGASVALDRLEQKWRTAAIEECNLTMSERRALRRCADELATLRASLAQQGEAVATFTVTNCGPCLPDLDMEWLSDYRTFAGKGPQLLFTHPAAVDADGQSAMWALRQILHDLPTRRDWLCPDVEKVARAIVTRNPYADLTAALLPATSEGDKA